MLRNKKIWEKKRLKMARISKFSCSKTQKFFENWTFSTKNYSWQNMPMTQSKAKQSKAKSNFFELQKVPKKAKQSKVVSKNT